MSNYPPGVTGQEYQIAGPKSEWDEKRTVEHECDEDKFSEPFKGDVEGTVIRWDANSQTFYWECPQCHEDQESEDGLDMDAYED